VNKIGLSCKNLSTPDWTDREGQIYVKTLVGLLRFYAHTCTVYTTVKMKVTTIKMKFIAVKIKFTTVKMKFTPVKIKFTTVKMKFTPVKIKFTTVK